MLGKRRHGPVSNEANGARATSSTARRPARCAASSSRSSGLALVALGEEQVAVEALEVAVDALLLDDGLDAVDRRGVAVGGEPRASRPCSFSTSK